jgi:hypothetical protein
MKTWQNYANTSGALLFTAVNDAESAETAWLTVERSAGITLASATFGAPVFSTVASGSVAYRMLQGARLITNGATATRYISDDGTNLTIAGPLLVAGTLAATGVITGAAATLTTIRSTAPNSGTPTGVRISNTPTLTQAGSRIMEVCAGNGVSCYFAIDLNGATVTNYTDGGGTTGNQTINTARFRGAFAAASASITITNSAVTAETSEVSCSLQRADATCTSVYTTPAAGSVVIATNAACTATTKVSCIVHN